jgi:hypothetical protein
MAIIDWPLTSEFMVTEFRVSVATQKSSFAAVHTGQIQTINHYADRLKVSISLPPTDENGSGERESFIQALESSGDRVKLPHFQRPCPLGTLRGAPTARVAALAGAMQLMVQTTAGATLKAGDMLGVQSQLCQCAYPGATADAAGQLTMPLTIPIRNAVPAGAALVWDRPTGVFQLMSNQTEFIYSSNRIQSGIELMFLETYA